MKRFFTSACCFLLIAVLLLPMAACKRSRQEGDLPTLLDRARELVVAVDSVPTTAALNGIGGKSSATNPVTVRYPTLSAGETDITDPAANADYQSALAEREGRAMDMFNAQITNADRYVQYIKDMKDVAVSHITQLGAWVDVTPLLQEGVQTANMDVMRLQYDAKNDVVHLEAFNDRVLSDSARHIEYYSIEATYTEARKAVVRAYRVSLRDGEVQEKMSISFEEGIYHAISCDSNAGERPDDYDFFCYADLTSPDKDAFVLHKGRTGRFSKLGEQHMYIQLEPSNIIQYIEDAAGNNVGMYQLSEGRVPMPDGSIWRYRNLSFSIEAYLLNGITKITKSGDTYRAFVGDVELEGETSFDGYTVSARVCAATNNSASVYQYPELRVSVFVDEGNEQPMQEMLKAYLASVGLSLKDSDLQRQMDAMDDSDAFFNSFAYIAKKGIANVDPEWIQAQFDKYEHKMHTAAEILSFADAARVSVKAQTPTEEYYSIFDATFAGTATLNTESFVVDLSGISVQAKESALLTLGGTYGLYAVLSDGFTSTEIGSVAAVWEMGDITLQGLGSYDLSTLPVGEYTVKVFFGQKTDAGVTRMSPLQSVGAAPAAAEKVVGQNNVALKATAEEIRISVSVIETEETDGEARTPQ